MQVDSSLTDFYPILIRLLIDVVGALGLMYGMYYRRYRDRELTVSAALSNIFAFSVLMILANVQFSIAAGFGLFAILALFTFRSEQMGVIQISYFFGCVAIAVICSLQDTDLGIVLFAISLLLLFAYMLDHPSFLPKVNSLKITLDYIDDEALSNNTLMCEKLSQRLGVEVLSCNIKNVNYINEMVVVSVNYKSH